MGRRKYEAFAVFDLKFWFEVEICSYINVGASTSTYLHDCGQFSIPLFCRWNERIYCRDRRPRLSFTDITTLRKYSLVIRTGGDPCPYNNVYLLYSFLYQFFSSRTDLGRAMLVPIMVNLPVKPEFDYRKGCRNATAFNYEYQIQAVTILLASPRSSILTASSRILYFSIFPAAFMGKESTKAT